MISEGEKKLTFRISYVLYLSFCYVCICMQHFTCIHLFILYVIFCGDELKSLLADKFASKYSPAPPDSVYI